MADHEGTKATGTQYYDTLYGTFAETLQASIRSEAFGEDIGQNSWLTADEHRGFFALLGLDRYAHALEIASGSGGPALFMAGTTGCRVTGVELHDAGVAEANRAATQAGLADRVRFVQADAREILPFADATFDAVICIDSMNHLYERSRVLAEWHRLVRSGGRILFTDPIVVTGMIRREEMIARSAGMGDFVFTAPGVDEGLVRDAGFVDVEVLDHTPNTAEVASRWASARRKRMTDLTTVEGEASAIELTEYLDTVAALARERRLSRLIVVAKRP